MNILSTSIQRCIYTHTCACNYTCNSCQIFLLVHFELWWYVLRCFWDIYDAFLALHSVLLWTWVSLSFLKRQLFRMKWMLLPQPSPLPQAHFWMDSYRELPSNCADEQGSILLGLWRLKEVRLSTLQLYICKEITFLCCRNVQSFLPPSAGEVPRSRA